MDCFSRSSNGFTAFVTDGGRRFAIIRPAPPIIPSAPFARAAPPIASGKLVLAGGPCISPDIRAAWLPASFTAAVEAPPTTAFAPNIASFFSHSWLPGIAAIA